MSFALVQPSFRFSREIALISIDGTTQQKQRYEVHTKRVWSSSQRVSYTYGMNSASMTFILSRLSVDEKSIYAFEKFYMLHDRCCRTWTSDLHGSRQISYAGKSIADETFCWKFIDLSVYLLRGGWELYQSCMVLQTRLATCTLANAIWYNECSHPCIFPKGLSFSWAPWSQ